MFPNRNPKITKSIIFFDVKNNFNSQNHQKHYIRNVSDAVCPQMSPRRPNKESSYCSALCPRVRTRRPKTADETSPKLLQHHQKHYIRNVSGTIWPQHETPISQKNTACVTFRTLFCSQNNRKHYIHSVSETFCCQNEIPEIQN